MRDVHPVLNTSDCILHAGTAPNPRNPMVVFNPLWGNNPLVHMADRKIQVVTPSDPLKGVELVTNPQGKPFSICHGYDRDWDMKLLFEHKYNSNPNITFEAYRKYNEEFARHLPIPIAVRALRLRREQNEGTVVHSQLPQPGRVFKRH